MAASPVILTSGLVNLSDYSPICVVFVCFFSDFSDDSKYPNPSGMICNFSNFQQGAHHGGCTSNMTGASRGASNVMTVSLLILVIRPCKFQQL